MNQFRVVMEDQHNGEKFKFAIVVEGVYTGGSETLAQYGITEEDARIQDAIYKALNEFPGSVIVKATMIEESLVNQ